MTFKKLLLFIILILAGFTNAQTFYWVGGPGYWNDINHWSFTSGGSLANAIPSANSNVVFDNNSASSSFTIHALHSFGFKSITAQNTAFKIDIIGSPNVDLTVNGDVTLNEHFFLKLFHRIRWLDNNNSFSNICNLKSIISSLYSFLYSI